MSNLEKAMGDTLALVNVVRQSFGKDALNDLPVSLPGHASACLYANALHDIGGASVSGGGKIGFTSERIAQHVASLWGVKAEGQTVQAPSQFAEVISEFDGGSLLAYNKDR